MRDVLKFAFATVLVGAVGGMLGTVGCGSDGGSNPDSGTDSKVTGSGGKGSGGSATGSGGSATGSGGSTTGSGGSTTGSGGSATGSGGSTTGSGGSTTGSGGAGGSAGAGGGTAAGGRGGEGGSPGAGGSAGGGGRGAMGGRGGMGGGAGGRGGRGGGAGGTAGAGMAGAGGNAGAAGGTAGAAGGTAGAAGGNAGGAGGNAGGAGGGAGGAAATYVAAYAAIAPFGTGTIVGTASLVPVTGGVKISVTVNNCPMGAHGIHIHAGTACTDATTQGGHLGGTGTTANPSRGEGMGDLNCNALGMGMLEYTRMDTDPALKWTLGGGAVESNVVGHPLVIHAVGGSDRLACGMIMPATN